MGSTFFHLRGPERACLRGALCTRGILGPGGVPCCHSGCLQTLPRHAPSLTSASSRAVRGLPPDSFLRFLSVRQCLPQVTGVLLSGRRHTGRPRRLGEGSWSLGMAAVPRRLESDALTPLPQVRQPAVPPLLSTDTAVPRRWSLADRMPFTPAQFYPAPNRDHCGDHPCLVVLALGTSLWRQGLCFVLCDSGSSAASALPEFPW